MNEKIVIHPIAAIRLFAETLTVEKEAVWKEEKYHRVRDAWAAGMFLLGFGALDKREWWLDTDFLAYTFIKNEKDEIVAKKPSTIKIFEWLENDPETDFLAVLGRIKLHTLIDSELTILFHIRKKTKIPTFHELCELTKQLHPKVKDIWLLVNTPEHPSSWIVGSIYPHPTGVTLDYDKVLDAKVSHTFLKQTNNLPDAAYEIADEPIDLTTDFKIKH